ncbi:MAG: acyl-CoA dehydrogenase [Alphaproteobacteria bacterium]|nr:acyl-CoA dehydrogenase [Alphaproteobacteria bacterium]MCB9928050.1 acyl-CoA dehydrogenase [Alphaproteobacteria bacterium]
MAQIAEEHRMLQELVAKFVDEELMPLEKNVLDREASGGVGGLSAEEEAGLFAKCKELGLWALDAPEEVGGMDLPALALVGVNFELGRTAVPFVFPPDAPNMHMMVKVANEEQKRKYLNPYVTGDFGSAIGISEPGAGGDPAEMRTRAVKDGDHWVINGRKIWVSRVPKADFLILMAVTDPAKKARGGITAFLVDKGTPGFTIEREIKMLAGARTYELVFEDMRLPESQVLGEIGNGFGPMQHRLTVRRLQMGAWCVGMANRALKMMCEQAQQRVTFGSRLAEKQAIQWWIADAATKIHATKLMVLDAAEKQDAGVADLRTEASMIKLFATEMVSEVLDHAMQTFGAMGMTKELPLQLMAQRARLMRIYEGPSEVHRMVISRRTLRELG